MALSFDDFESQVRSFFNEQEVTTYQVTNEEILYEARTGTYTVSYLRSTDWECSSKGLRGRGSNLPEAVSRYLHLSLTTKG